MKRYTLKGGGNSDGTRRETRLGWIMFVPLVCWTFASSASGQDWIEFTDETCRINSLLVDDIPCGDTSGCSIATCSPSCLAACACEKDMAVGDLNGDGKEDLVIVRKQPIYLAGGASNLLFLNEDGIMVDRTDLVDGFANPNVPEDPANHTEDRDVVIVDVDFDPLSDMNMPDVVTAATFGDLPRVYINLGCCSKGCSPSKHCPPGKKIICEPGATWCGLQYEPGRLLDPFPNAPFFCGMGAGDINGDGCPDLYFADYAFGQTRLFDRLLINQTDGNGKCLGTFKDETDSILGDFSAFTNSLFSTGAQIVDLNGDFCNDILKSQAGRIDVLYNSTDAGGLCTGTFIAIEKVSDGNAYMVAADDVNNDSHNDIYVVDDNLDRFRINRRVGRVCLEGDIDGSPCTSDSDCIGGGTCSVFAAEQTVNNSPKTVDFGGNVRLTDMNGDNLRDVVLSDVDVAEPGCERQLALLRTDVLCEGGINDGLPCTLDTDCPGGTCSDVTISDPLGSDERDWNTLGTYDTAVFDVNGDGKLDLWTGTCSGNRLFIQGGPTFVVMSPPAGTLDARRPHPSNDNSLAARQGIGSGNIYTGGPEPITINLGVTGAALLALWDLCETGIEQVEGTPLEPNSIISVTEVLTEVYEIVLERPISSGHWTTITYLGDCTGSSVVSYASLPADSNADGVSNGLDVTDFLDCCISQICTPPHGIYSCDIDHSGATGFPDVLELIDLLDGLGLFIPWDGVTLPNNTCMGGGQSSASAQQELATSAGGALSTGALNQHFGDRFVAYLSTGTLADAVTEQDFRLILEALTRWAVDHFSREERETLASRLQNPSLSFESPTAAQMIPGIVAALLK